MHLKDGGSVQEHIKATTEIFESLSVVGDPGSRCSLASESNSYNMLVTALQNVPQIEVVTECLLHEEHKLNDRGSSSGTNRLIVTREML